MRVYLGGPINGCTDEEASGWRDAVKPLLEKRGHTWVDPMSRDYRGREMDPGIAEEIVRGDLADIQGCDVCLFNCPKPSYGTAMEIFYSASIDKRVIAVLPADGRDPSPWLVVHSDVLARGSAVEAVARHLP